MKVGLVSLNQKWENKSGNKELCTKYVIDAKNNGVDLIVFPEMTLTGFTMNTSIYGEQGDNSESVEFFKKLATDNNINIVYGIIIQDKGDYYNKLYYVDSYGKTFTYSKIHTFSFAKEDIYYKKGDSLLISKINDFNVGFTICYDLRFPELYSILGEKCDLVINIANWPEKRYNHWDTLLRARAIEQQIYIAGVNRTGCDGNGLSYTESSRIYDFNGVEPEYMICNDIKIYNINLSNIFDFKKVFDTTKDKRSDLYYKLRRDDSCVRR